MTVELTVRAKPGARRPAGVEPAGESDPSGAELVVFVRARAHDGEANEAVRHAVAAHYGVPNRAVEIVRGHTSRVKRLRVEGVEPTSA